MASRPRQSRPGTRHRCAPGSNPLCCHRPRGQTGRAHCAVASCREAALAAQYCCALLDTEAMGFRRGGGGVCESLSQTAR
jgi:hypothetical protein